MDPLRSSFHPSVMSSGLTTRPRRRRRNRPGESIPMATLSPPPRLGLHRLPSGLLLFFTAAVLLFSSRWPTTHAKIPGSEWNLSRQSLQPLSLLRAPLRRRGGPWSHSVLKDLRGGSSAAAAAASIPSSEATEPIVRMRVAYQGEPGAYSEKATKELLGENVLAVGHPNFEACFRAVASMECEYACLPVENSLGGSIHENYDLMLRYDLVIIGEHEFRVKHCLLVKEGVKQDQIKYAISHPQALAQCDNYLRGLGITPVPTYDTAGSAKMISEASSDLPAQCTPDNTAAIASDLAGRTYGLQCLAEGIEDDDTNFTRFLLLARKGVAEFLHAHIPSKTSIVFTLPNSPGCLYKALACFALRDLDSSKIESRPTSASLLNFLKFKSQRSGRKSRSRADLPRFRYCFYLDFLAGQLDEAAQNALAHLREQSDFVRVLGSYPQKSKLVGPVAHQVERLRQMAVPDTAAAAIADSLLGGRNSHGRGNDADSAVKPLRIGIVGFDHFGQFLAQRLALKHQVSCLDKADRVSCDVWTLERCFFGSGRSHACHSQSAAASRSLQSKEAQKLNVEYFSSFEMSKFLAPLDVVVIAVPLVDFEDTVHSLPASNLRGKLVVETCVLSSHPKAVLLQAFGDVPDIDLVSSHPMFGPVAFSADLGADPNPYSATSWDGRPLVYEKVRVSNVPRWQRFLQIFEAARCKLVEMTAEQHDASIADAEFVTHLTGRLLVDRQMLPPTPVVSKEYAALADVADMTGGDSFDKFFGMYKFNGRARSHIAKLRDNLAALERQLAAKEAYLEASAELQTRDRQRLLEETRLLIREVVAQQNSDGGPVESTTAGAAGSGSTTTTSTIDAAAVPKAFAARSGNATAATGTVKPNQSK